MILDLLKLISGASLRPGRFARAVDPATSRVGLSVSCLLSLMARASPALGSSAPVSSLRPVRRPFRSNTRRPFRPEPLYKIKNKIKNKTNKNNKQQYKRIKNKTNKKNRNI